MLRVLVVQTEEPVWFKDDLVPGTSCPASAYSMPFWKPDPSLSIKQQPPKSTMRTSVFVYTEYPPGELLLLRWYLYPVELPLYKLDEILADVHEEYKDLLE